MRRSDRSSDRGLPSHPDCAATHRIASRIAARRLPGPPLPLLRRSSLVPRQRTVLIVDDNADSRTIYTTYLAHVGFAVLVAADAEAAVPLAQAHRPDVVLMDVELPGMDGYTAAHTLTADPRTAGIPIVMLTAHAGQVARDRAAAAGCALFLAKPLDPRTLAAEVTRLLAVERPT